MMHLSTTPARLRLLAAAALLALAGCQSAPDEMPGAPVIDLPATYGEDSAAAASPNLGWDQVVIDPELLRLIRQALAGNRDLRVALLRVAEARAAAGIQQADRLPTLAAGAAALRASVPADLSGTGSRVTGTQLGLSVGFTSWEIDLWGRVRSLSEAAIQTYLQTEAAARAARLSLATQVADTYLAVRELDARLALARQAAASRAETLRIFRRRLELGAISQLELTQVELLRQQAETLVTQLEQARATQAHALDVLVGSPAGLAPTAADDAEVLRDVAPGLPSDLLTRRPDIAAAEHALLAAQANIAAARAAFLPRIALTAEAGVASADLDRLFADGAGAWSFSPTVSLPIFDGGRLRASLDLAEIRRDSAVARYEAAVQSAFRDVADALSARVWLARQARSLDATARTLGERARLARSRYASGAASHLEVLDAERDLLAVGQEQVRVRAARRAAQVALIAALGGGDEPSPPSR